jgi:hypothetical protein
VHLHVDEALAFCTSALPGCITPKCTLVKDALHKASDQKVARSNRAGSVYIYKGRTYTNTIFTALNLLSWQALIILVQFGPDKHKRKGDLQILSIQSSITAD